MRAESSPAARTGAFAAVAVARVRRGSAPDRALPVPAASVAAMAGHHRPACLVTVPPPAPGLRHNERTTPSVRHGEPTAPGLRHGGGTP
ncbi:hypothetical protein ACISU4_11150 [Streptomyces wuyuanensis]|uniref:hypothetical protein n=1 Tax=Streptomyces wuyuanensis TaxID=1196353 RepID=UPI003808E2AD